MVLQEICRQYRYRNYRDRQAGEAFFRLVGNGSSHWAQLLRAPIRPRFGLPDRGRCFVRGSLGISDIVPHGALGFSAKP